MKTRTEAEKMVAAKQEIIKQKLGLIKEVVAAYGKGEQINWAHAGSLVHVDKQLNEICEFLGIITL